MKEEEEVAVESSMAEPPRQLEKVQVEKVTTEPPKYNKKDSRRFVTLYNDQTIN